MKTDKYGIPLIRCRTAKGFLTQLDELHDRWARSTWIFRGQNDASRALYPKAMRKDGLIARLVKERLDKYTDRTLVTNDAAKQCCLQMDDDEFRERVWHALHVSIEKKVVGAFTELADQSRLDVPTDTLGKVGGSRWPLERLVSHYVNKACLYEIEHYPRSIIYALAQHHGIPTRLMDWTFRSMVAAFFAAYEFNLSRCSSNGKVPTHMAVWAVRWPDLGRSGLLRLTHQRNLIGNLQAQEGLFLYNPLADKDRPSRHSWLNFDHLLETIVQFEAVYKITLPFSQRHEVLELLARLGYRRPYLMPTFDNVADEFISGRLDPIEFHERH
ncbi:MAG: FRG domain-containing protein [Chloroflexota bacterium]|nr:FRG domain-containing protein [Chloroflexota bacterium]MDE2908785.1 FRG domain-containing protein [Chloroflexota bacterium]